MHNVISSPAQAARVPELRAELDRLMQRHHALPEHMPLDEGIKTVLPKY